MIGEVKLKQLHTLFETFSKEELIWVNGYLSGLVAHTAMPQMALEVATAQRQDAPQKIHLVYGTETGNSKSLAIHLASIAKKNGLPLKLTDLAQYRLTDLEKETNLFLIVSTQGEGEPPIGAKKFYDYIHQNQLLLPQLKFGVLALGDAAYPLFCKTGVDVDAQLHNLGGKRITPLIKCNVDYESQALQWFQAIMNLMKPGPALHHPDPIKKAFDKPIGKKYYDGNLIANINLNDRGSNKQTYHIEIECSEPIDYEPGDTLGIVPKNRADVVEKIIALSGASHLLMVQTTKHHDTILNLLTYHLNICFLLSTTIKKYAAITQQQIPEIRMDLLDLLRIYPVKNAAEFIEVIKILMPISPRLYSISSSPATHGKNEIHITVAKHQYMAADQAQDGLCSQFLGDLPVANQVSFYVHRVKNFKLPDSQKNIIMIGPGTGIAPFRSFLLERDALGATGKNWFFFGEQHFATDFLYQTEMQSLGNTGVLTKIDLAFSRDQPQKIYVQHRMKQNAFELYAWLQNGAHIYVSGSKHPMSKEVENTLVEIIAEQGNKTRDEATQYIKMLEQEKRYEKDVY